MRRARRKHGPTNELLMLRRIEYWNHLLFWAKTEDAKKSRDKPEPIKLPGEHETTSAKRDPRTLEARLADRQARREAELAAMTKGAA